MAQSIDNKTIIVGECKWSSISDSDALLAHLTEKAKKLPFAKGKKIIPMLFAKDCKTVTENVLTANEIVC